MKRFCFLENFRNKFSQFVGSFVKISRISILYFREIQNFSLTSGFANSADYCVPEYHVLPPCSALAVYCSPSSSCPWSRQNVCVSCRLCLAQVSLLYGRFFLSRCLPSSSKLTESWLFPYYLKWIFPEPPQPRKWDTSKTLGNDMYIVLQKKLFYLKVWTFLMLIEVRWRAWFLAPHTLYNIYVQWALLPVLRDSNWRPC